MFRAIRIAIAAVVVAGSFAAVAEATVSPTGPCDADRDHGREPLGTVACTGGGGAWRRSSTPTR